MPEGNHFQSFKKPEGRERIYKAGIPMKKKQKTRCSWNIRITLYAPVKTNLSLLIISPQVILDLQPPA